MKKLLVSAILLATGFVNAQDVKFGVKLGLNIANISGDIEDNKSLFGANLGGFAEIKLSDKLAFQPELLFSMQGSKYEDIATKLNYINIPLLAKYNLNEKFSVLAGPQIGFLMSAKLKDSTKSVDIKEGFNTTDFGLNVGAGYNVTENILVDARYNFGLSNILKDADGFSQKNSVFQLSIGYKF
jgi:opacity protein-like surface antigen